MGRKCARAPTGGCGGVHGAVSVRIAALVSVVTRVVGSKWTGLGTSQLRKKTSSNQPKFGTHALYMYIFIFAWPSGSEIRSADFPAFHFGVFCGGPPPLQ